MRTTYQTLLTSLSRNGVWWKSHFFTFRSKVAFRGQSRYMPVWDATRGAHLPLRCAFSYYTPPHWPKMDESLAYQVGIFDKLNTLNSSLQALIAISWPSQAKWMLSWKICIAGKAMWRVGILKCFQSYVFFGGECHDDYRPPLRIPSIFSQEANFREIRLGAPTSYLLL